MECMNNRYSLNLTDSEQVLYIPNKNNVEFFVSFPLAVFGFCFFSWIIGVLTLKNVFILSELFIIALDVLCARQLYEYFRDYFFSKIFLTNEKIIIFRFNKIISVNYNQIEKIYYQEGRKSPSYFAILLNSQKIYKISFIPIKQFKQKIEEINQEIQYKNSVFWSSEILNTIYLAFSKNNQIQIKQENVDENPDCWIIQPKRIFMLKSTALLLFFTVLFYLFYKIGPSYSYIRFLELALSFLFGSLTILLLPRYIFLKPSLIVKTEGLYYQDIFIPWHNVNDFSLNSITPNSQIVLINLNNFEEIINQFKPIKRKIVMQNKKTVGDALPISLYGTNLQKIDVLKKLKNYLEISRKSVG